MNFTDRLGSLKKDDPTPLYLQLQRALREAIHDNVIRPDNAIPTERDLATDLGISRITVRKAIDGLVEEGILARRQGAGTFVVGGRVEKSFSRISSFSEDMIARGRKPRSVWVSRTTGTVTPEEALLLGLSPGTEVYRFQRIRYADDQSMALEYATVPAFCLPSIKVVTDSLYEALAASGHRPVRALQRVRAIAFSAEQAKALDVEVGSPGLFIERRGFMADGRTVEYTQSFYRGDAYDLVAELSS